MPLSASRTMQPHRPKAFEREGMPVWDEHGWGDAPEWTVRMNGMVGNPIDEATATAALVHLLRLGYRFPAVALLRRDGPDGEWRVVEVEPTVANASRLRPVNARPYSHWRR